MYNGFVVAKQFAHHLKICSFLFILGPAAVKMYSNAIYIYIEVSHDDIILHEFIYIQIELMLASTEPNEPDERRVYVTAH